MIFVGADPVTGEGSPGFPHSIVIMTILMAVRKRDIKMKGA